MKNQGTDKCKINGKLYSNCKEHEWDIRVVIESGSCVRGMLTFTSRYLLPEDLQCRAPELMQVHDLWQISLAMAGRGICLRKLMQNCPDWNFVGGDSGLDGLGGPGVQLGSPDKKKRKANTQVNSLRFFWFVNTQMLFAGMTVLLCSEYQSIPTNSVHIQNILAVLWSRNLHSFATFTELDHPGYSHWRYFRSLQVTEVLQRKERSETATTCILPYVLWFWDRLSLNDFVAIGRICTARVVVMRLIFFFLLFLYM